MIICIDLNDYINNKREQCNIALFHQWLCINFY